MVREILRQHRPRNFAERGAAMTQLYECSRCGVVSHAGEQLCGPEERRDIHAYCGAAPERDAMCADMRQHLAYVCGSCGRPAEQPELVCKPLVTG